MTQLEKLEDIARTLHEAGAVGDAATILWAARRIREYEKGQANEVLSHGPARRP